jgi:hypothetical protein
MENILDMTPFLWAAKFTIASTPRQLEIFQAAEIMSSVLKSEL